MPALMHDPVYRLGVAWQNVVYNQPPHLGFYLPDRMKNIKNK
jgi:rhamnogalacturonan endolyase